MNNKTPATHDKAKELLEILNRFVNCENTNPDELLTRAEFERIKKETGFSESNDPVTCEEIEAFFNYIRKQLVRGMVKDIINEVETTGKQD